MKKRAKGPCDRCSLCDLARFDGWRRRVEAGLPFDTSENSERFALIQEIHNDVARRYPIGIAIRLSNVIEALGYAEDEHGDADAVSDLSDLETDEIQSTKLNGTRDSCAAGKAFWKKNYA